MEQFLDALAAFLQINVITTPSLSWIIGDFGMSSPTSLPFGYIVPLNDAVEPRTSGIHGYDMDTYTVPLLIVDDLHNYGSPVANANAAGTFEQPGYRKLMQYGQAIRAAMRGPVGTGQSGVTIGGQVAKSTVTEMRYVWVQIDDKPYRGIRITIVAQTRRSRT